MKTTEFIRNHLEGSRRWALGLITDMKEQPLARPLGDEGNHPIWLLGHLTFSEAALFDMGILGKPNRYADHGEQFAGGTQPVSDASVYPTMDEILTVWEEIRSDVLAHLDGLSDEDLNQPCNEITGGPTLSTVADCFGAMILHTMHHAGQAADVRRAAGRQVLAF